MSPPLSRRALLADAAAAATTGFTAAPAGSAVTVEELRKQLEALSAALAGGPTQGLGGNARLAIGSLGGSALVANFGRPLAVGAGSRRVSSVVIKGGSPGSKRAPLA